MRILIVHNAYAQPGGEDAVVHAESEALRARGHEVVLAVRDSAALHASPARGALETLFTAANPDAGRELARIVRRVAPDVVHIHNLLPRWGLSALRALMQLDVPTVQTLHNFRWLCAPATFLRDQRECRRCAGGNFVSAVRFACMKDSRAVSAAYALALASNRRTHLAERAVTRFICVSDFVRRVYRGVGFAPDKLTVKGHFVSAAPGPEGEGDGSVIFVGRLSPEKGAQVLLRAVADQSDLTVKIVGDGPERAALEAQAATSRARVRFLGRLARDQLWHELRRSSVCVVPSLGTETFGLAAIEAFACGLPVVTSDAGGLPELVVEGENGFVVPRGDHAALAATLQVLRAQPERARMLGRAGHRLVQQSYLPPMNMARLEHVYREAIGAHARAAKSVR